MATDTVFDVGYAFLTVLGNDLCWLVLVASVARVALVIPAQMTGRTSDVVIAVELEIALVDESRRLPARRLVARRTRQVLSAMQVVARRHVAGLAMQTRVGLQQRVIEDDRTRLGQSWSGVIAVAGHAIGFGQRLMEGGPCCRLRDCRALGRTQADICDDMAGYATLG